MRKLLYVFAISMVPLIELRGGVIAGAAMGLPWWQNYIACVLGNLLPVPFILLFIEKIFAWMKEKNIFPRLIGWLENKAQAGAARVTRYALAGLFLFVAFPIPGTGAWTGSLIAALFHMPRRWALISVALGVLCCGVIMTLASYGVVAGLSFLAKK